MLTITKKSLIVSLGVSLLGIHQASATLPQDEENAPTTPRQNVAAVVSTSNAPVVAATSNATDEVVNLEQGMANLTMQQSEPVLEAPKTPKKKIGKSIRKPEDHISVDLLARELFPNNVVTIARNNFKTNQLRRIRALNNN